MPQETFSPTDPRFAASLASAQQQLPAQPPSYVERLAALAEMLGQANPVGGTATLGARLPVVPLVQQALGFMSKPSDVVPQGAFEAVQLRAAKEAIGSFLRNFPGEIEKVAWRQEYPIVNRRQMEFDFTPAGTAPPLSIPPPTQGGGTHRGSFGVKSSGAKWDPSAAILLPEDIRNILGTLRPPIAPPAMLAPKVRQPNLGPRIGRRPSA